MVKKLKVDGKEHDKKSKENVKIEYAFYFTGQNNDIVEINLVDRILGAG